MPKEDQADWRRQDLALWQALRTMPKFVNGEESDRFAGQQFVQNGVHFSVTFLLDKCEHVNTLGVHHVAWLAIAISGQQKEPAMIETLTTYAKRGSGLAIGSLASIGIHAARDALHSLISPDSSSRNHDIVRVLRSMGDESTVAMLQTLSEDARYSESDREAFGHAAKKIQEAKSTDRNQSP